MCAVQISPFLSFLWPPLGGRKNTDIYCLIAGVTGDMCREEVPHITPTLEFAAFLGLLEGWYTGERHDVCVEATVGSPEGIPILTEIQTRVLRGAEPAKMLRQTIASAKTLYQDQSGTNPTLATLLVGNDAAALAYRASIERTFKKVEITHRKVELPAQTTNNQLATAIQALNNDPDVTGILVLMPLPAQLDPHVVLENISPLKDVDGISPVNAGRLHLGLPSLKPSTPAGGLELLRYYGVELNGANVAVVGRSNVVGRPLSTMLSHANATVTLCHSKTRNLSQHLRRAEIVCVAAGKPGLITGRMVRKGALVLDFGVNVTADGKVVGDSDIAGLEGIASAITPTPGGTGPVTAMVLARNILAAGFAQLEGTLDALQELEAMLQCPLPDISEFLEPIQLQD